MNYQILLSLKELLACTSALQLHILDSLQADLRSIDAGLRTQFENSEQIYDAVRQLLAKELTPDSILHLQDPFCLHYVAFVPDASSDVVCVLGPFLTDDSQGNHFILYLQQTVNLPRLSANAVLSSAQSILSLAGRKENRSVKQVRLHTDPALMVRLSADQYNGTSSVIQRLVYYIKTNLHKKLTLHSLSEQFGFSPTYISHHFKEELGIPPMQYIIQQRILFAKYLLRATDKPVQEIAGNVGISDWSYFTKLFREHTGTTPTEYRKAYK